MPQHVAIIMDGNGRWAKEKGKLRLVGHKNGVQAVRKAVTFAAQHHIRSLTLYAFSSENWSRPESEVSGLMDLFMLALNREVGKLHKNNIKLRILGDIGQFSRSLQAKISEAEALTAENSGLILNIAANYGGQWDIVQAAQALAKQVKCGQLQPDQITPALLQQHLVTERQAPVDLLIRTSGEQRISNFLLWQAAYAEFYFSPVLWPDFDEHAFAEAIIAFQARDRRFGATD
ncbi:UDP pyrophosphate synthase [Chelonobacter oris]|uniref:Ditrans,polycis-undecaprenyl-diphosphate synthase ((2E,6E)-farnesyl-diphosphate specific) n=2 Tax=Chelonobacter oris TaxID=505317 RepID=A0A0A3APZ7_9PAST|nr:UDP pyrophosphate synthase [Chelonobacter oris]